MTETGCLICIVCDRPFTTWPCLMYKGTVRTWGVCPGECTKTAELFIDEMARKLERERIIGQ